MSWDGCVATSNIIPWVTILSTVLVYYNRTYFFIVEKIIIYAADMTNEGLETLASNCPDLSDIRICLVQKYHDSHPVCPTLLLRSCTLLFSALIREFDGVLVTQV